MGKHRHRGKKAKRKREKARFDPDRSARPTPLSPDPAPSPDPRVLDPRVLDPHSLAAPGVATRGTDPPGIDVQRLVPQRRGLTMDHLDAPADAPETEVTPARADAAEAIAASDRASDPVVVADAGSFDLTEPGPVVATRVDSPPVSRETPTTAHEPPTTSPLPRPDRTHVFVVANQKGGVGKTTTAVNLAAALAQGGLDVLVVDLDPQGNASTALGVDHRQGTPGTYDVLLNGLAMGDAVVVSGESDHLRVLPATIDLAGAEIELVSAVARESKLARALTAYLAEHPADFVLLDCPPSLGLLTLNALVAASEILVPIQCEYYALEGVSQLVRTIELVKGELNAGLRLGTVLLTMYDGRTRLAAQVAEEVRTHFARETLSVMIPRSVRISEAPSYGQTVLSYDPESTGARSYREAAREIAHRSQPQEQR